MRKFLSLLLLLSNTTIFAQRAIKKEKIANYSTYIKGSKFEGCIFSEKYNGFFGSELNNKTKLTLTTSEIVEAEKLLLNDVWNKQNTVITDPFIRKHLDKYLRQYVGFINTNGQKIVFISFLWKKSMIDDEKLYRQFPKIQVHNWKNEWIIVNDGGNSYWEIKINLSSSLLFDFGENGVA